MSLRFATATHIGAICIFLAGLGAMTVPAPTKDTLPAVQFVGHNSKITTPRVVLAEDQPTWTLLWCEHVGLDASVTPPTRHLVPKIDFTRYVVVGVFGGEMTNTDGEVAEGVVISDDAVRIRYVSSTFQTSSFGGNADPGVKTAPFGLWVIEKIKKPIVIEQGTRGLKDSPLSWKEVKRFEAK